MKTWLKIGIVFLVLGSVGIIVFGIQTAGNLSTLFSGTDDYTYVEESYSAEDFTKILLSYDDQSITVAESDDDTIKVEYYSLYYNPVEVSTEDGVLSFINHYDWWDFIYFNFGTTAVKEFKLYIPADLEIAIDLTTINGRIEVLNLTSLTELSAVTTTGNLEVINVTVDSSTSVSSINGNISFLNLVVHGDFVANTVNGSVQANTLTADTVNLYTTYGSILVSFMYSSEIHIHTETGGITVSPTTDFVETYLTMSTVVGIYYVDGSSVTINSYNDSAVNRLECKTVYGDIKIIFPS